MFAPPIFQNVAWIEQWTCNKVCFRNSSSVTKTLGMLQKAFDGDLLLKTRVLEQYKMFKEDREYVEDEPHSGKPSISIDE